jgi:hypothetical protein
MANGVNIAMVVDYVNLLTATFAINGHSRHILWLFVGRQRTILTRAVYSKGLIKGFGSIALNVGMNLILDYLVSLMKNNVHIVVINNYAMILNVKCVMKNHVHLMKWPKHGLLEMN